MKVTRCEFVHGLKCEQVSRHITKLEGKIDGLREQLHTSLDDNRWLNEQNDKLRELVRIMHGELVSCEDNGYVCGGHKFDERVRELGIEVEA